jgi:hypothetical protein
LVRGIGEGEESHHGAVHRRVEGRNSDWRRQGEEYSVLHFAAFHKFPFAATARVIDAIGIDAQDRFGNTAIMSSVLRKHYNLLNELANMKTDLSIKKTTAKLFIESSTRFLAVA